MVYVLKMKSDLCVVIPIFLQYVKTQFNKSVKIIKTDNVTEFMNDVFTKLYQHLGIIHQRPCPYKPQQNSYY